MKLVARALALSVVVLPSLALTAPAQTRPETVGILLLRLQEDSAAPMIRHCVARIPAVKRPLDTEYARFRKRFRNATALLRAGIGKNSELSRTAPPELIRQFEEMDAESLTQVEKLDPHVFCAQLQENLSHATVASIRENMESAFARYTAQARRSRTT